MGFATLAEAAVDAVFQTLSCTATYYPASGAPFDVAVVRHRRDPVLTGFGETRHVHQGGTFDVRAADFDVAPAAGDKMTVSGTTLEIRSVTPGDDGGLTLHLDCVPA